MGCTDSKSLDVKNGNTIDKKNKENNPNINNKNETKEMDKDIVIRNDFFPDVDDNREESQCDEDNDEVDDEFSPYDYDNGLKESNMESEDKSSEEPKQETNEQPVEEVKEESNEISKEETKGEKESGSDESYDIASDGVVDQKADNQEVPTVTDGNDVDAGEDQNVSKEFEDNKTEESEPVVESSGENPNEINDNCIESSDNFGEKSNKTEEKTDLNDNSVNEVTTDSGDKTNDLSDENQNKIIVSSD